DAKGEGAIASGSFDRGLETITAESLRIIDRRAIYRHPVSGAESEVLTVARRDRNEPLSLDEALRRARDPHARLLVNAQSGRAGVQLPAPSLMLDDGEVERRVRLVGPVKRSAFSLGALGATHWREADEASFAASWNAELADV